MSTQIKNKVLADHLRELDAIDVQLRKTKLTQNIEERAEAVEHLTTLIQCIDFTALAELVDEAVDAESDKAA
jgi:hypothetical protein